MTTQNGCTEPLFHLYTVRHTDIQAARSVLANKYVQEVQFNLESWKLGILYTPNIQFRQGQSAAQLYTTFLNSKLLAHHITKKKTSNKVISKVRIKDHTLYTKMDTAGGGPNANIKSCQRSKWKLIQSPVKALNLNHFPKDIQYCKVFQRRNSHCFLAFPYYMLKMEQFAETPTSRGIIIQTTQGKDRQTSA